LEFEIYLEFDAWNLGFQKFRELLQYYIDLIGQAELNTFQRSYHDNFKPADRINKSTWQD